VEDQETELDLDVSRRAQNNTPAGNDEIDTTEIVAEDEQSKE
jgi:hypothetical protein